jgi:hypothetical protein
MQSSNPTITLPVALPGTLTGLPQPAGLPDDQLAFNARKGVADAAAGAAGEFNQFIRNMKRCARRKARLDLQLITGAPYYHPDSARQRTGIFGQSASMRCATCLFV